MTDSPSWGSGGSGELLVELVETLETCGLSRDEYRLHEHVDVEALEQLLTSSADDVEVRFSVGSVRLAVTPEDVDVLVGNSPE